MSVRTIPLLGAWTDTPVTTTDTLIMSSIFTDVSTRQLLLSLSASIGYISLFSGTPLPSYIVL